MAATITEETTAVTITEKTTAVTITEETTAVTIMEAGATIAATEAVDTEETGATMVSARIQSYNSSLHFTKTNQQTRERSNMEDMVVAMVEATATTTITTKTAATEVVVTKAVATKRERSSTMVVVDMAGMAAGEVTTAAMAVAGTDRLATAFIQRQILPCYTLPLSPCFDVWLAKMEKGTKKTNGTLRRRRGI